MGGWVSIQSTMSVLEQYSIFVKISFLPHILWKFIELAFLGSSLLAVDDIEMLLLKIDSFTFGIPHIRHDQARSL